MPRGKAIMLEDERRVLRYKAFYPAGPTYDAEGSESGFREHDLISFIAEEGGTRTVRVKDIVDIT